MRNDVLAEGVNNMNMLLEFVLRWYVHKVGFHTDVQKLYNSVCLSREFLVLLTLFMERSFESQKPCQGQGHQNNHLRGPTE